MKRPQQHRMIDVQQIGAIAPDTGVNPRYNRYLVTIQNTPTRERVGVYSLDITDSTAVAIDCHTSIANQSSLNLKADPESRPDQRGTAAAE